MDEEVRLLRAGRRAAEGARLRGRVVQHAGEGDARPTGSSSRARRSSSSPTCACPGPGFADSKKITDANPQQKDFLWGHRVLFDYKNKDGVRLQGILAMPDDYKPGEKRPMIVIFYEKNSQNMHVYSAPAYMLEHGPDAGAGGERRATSRCCRTSTSGPARRTATCWSASRRRRSKVIEMGYADPKRIGVSGHSYSGEGAAYIGTMSKMFAAVGMGAGVVDLYNDFSDELGLELRLPGRQRRHRVQLLPLRPGALGLLAVGPARPVPQRVGADVGAEGEPRRS
ncbi:MAG: hypothetical protein MZW92_04235 [Comamonadaceae bacterium]|nr:hypothetical protein [Comamonadaceae bacterium]